MKWFTFQGIILHAADNIDCTEEHLKWLLKVFLVFKTIIIYDDTIDDEDISDAVEIMCINCEKYWLLVRQSKDRKLHHSFCHKYVAPEYWFTLYNSVKQKPRFRFSKELFLLDT